jgi:hypothetical protein
VEFKKVDIDSLPEILEEDEWLLKVYEHKAPIGDHKLGFMSKLKKDGTLPVAFKDWKPNYREKIEDIFLVRETFRSGWVLTKYRAGMSQSWAVITSPEGIRFEIYLDNLFELLAGDGVVNNEIIGKYKWHDKKLIKA